MPRFLAALPLVVALTLLAPGASGADAVHPEWGHTSAADATIRPGCHGYPYSYAITPPPGDWGLETFLIGPHGKQLASGWFLTGDDPLTGTGSWRLCRRSTRGGTYTIRALLSVQDGSDYTEGWLPDTTFRFHKPRRHH